VNTRAPASDAGTQAASTECSDSVVSTSAWSSPFAWNSVMSSRMGVCGVIG